MDFPKWMPPQIIDTLDIYYDKVESLDSYEIRVEPHLDPVVASVVRKFVFDSRIEKIADDLVECRPETSKSDHIWLLFNEVISSLVRGTSFADVVPKNIRDKKLKSIQKVSSELIGLVHETKIEQMMLPLAQTQMFRAHENSKFESGFFQVSLEEILSDLSKLAELLEGTEGKLGNVKTNKVARQITYLAQDLHKYFMESYQTTFVTIIEKLIDIVFDKEAGREFVRGRRKGAEDMSNDDVRAHIWKS